MAMSIKALEPGINRILALDPETPTRLAALVGRSLGLRLTEPAVALRVEFHAEGLSLTPDDSEMDDCDAVLEATLAGLTGLVLSRGKRSRDVSFRGDVGTIQEVRVLFTKLNVDIEAQIASLIGETAAAQLASNGRAGREWSERSIETLLRNAGELVTEERRWLPTRIESRHFIDDVNTIREDVDRIEARLRQIEQKRSRS